MESVIPLPAQIPPLVAADRLNELSEIQIVLIGEIVALSRESIVAVTDVLEVKHEGSATSQS